MTQSITYKIQNATELNGTMAVINTTTLETNVFTMGVHCQIQIHKPRDGFHKAGGTVTGSVKYSVDEPTELEDIVLSLVERGQCVWTDYKPNLSLYSSYTGSEQFIADKRSIFDKKGQVTAILSKGTYEHGFRFIIPNDIPPSFKNFTCIIQYRICLKFAKSGLFASKKFIAPINVSGYVNPITRESRLDYFWTGKKLTKPVSSKDHTIKLKAEIPNTFFTPGQNAEIVLSVKNDSDVATAIGTELVCYTTYTADCGKKKHNVKYVKESAVDSVSVPANAVSNITSVIPVPARLRSIQHCRIMTKEYKVEVTVKLPMPHSNATVEAPVVIGDRRIMSPVASGSGAYSEKASEKAEPSTKAVKARDDEPPSYWEVMKEDKGKS